MWVCRLLGRVELRKVNQIKGKTFITWQTRHSPVSPSSPTLMLKKGLSCASFLFVRLVITTGRLSATLSLMMFTLSELRGASRICCC